MNNIAIQAAVAILHTVYAIYHLSRPSKGRTPASCASYMLFASVMDVGLIPFYVFTALMARMELQVTPGATGRWETLFKDDKITEKIVRATFLIGVVDGSIHLVSLVLSIYLAVIFRKISNLPPDMNPLEDNLTSRHKRKKSSLLDNRMSQATTTTANSKRESKEVEPLVSPTRSVPFMQTRNDSHTNICDVPYPLFSPRVSQTDVSAPVYDQPPSQRSSRIKFGDPSPTQSSAHRNSRTQFPNLTLQNRESPTKNNEQQGIQRSPTKSSSIYSGDNKPVTRFGSATSSVSDSNWITHPSPSSSPAYSPPREFKHLTTKKTTYQPLSQTAPFEYTSDEENIPPPLLGPLEMNPPTPPIGQKKRRNNGGGTIYGEARTLVPAAHNVRQGNWGPATVGIGKARTWGEMGPGPSPSGGTRVISRSGVEVRSGGILPTGGVRAREVSGKVMEEGRGSTKWDSIRV